MQVFQVFAPGDSDLDSNLMGEQFSQNSNQAEFVCHSA